MTETFEITENHIRLLRQVKLSWCNDEFGAPCIDPKRPYGNSSVYHDIAKIIGITPEGKDNDFTYQQYSQMNILHREIRDVLSIGIDTGSFRVGQYVRQTCFDPWKSKMEFKVK